MITDSGNSQILCGRGEMDEKTAVIKDAVKMIRELAPLLKQIESDDFSGDEWQSFRETVGGDAMPKLSNLVYRLCSETARTMARAGVTSVSGNTPMKAIAKLGALKKPPKTKTK